MCTRLGTRIVGTSPLLRPSAFALHSRAMSSFTLNKDIFNRSLYNDIQNVWFEGVELGSKELEPNVVKRWFAQTPEDKLSFDGLCRDRFGDALEAIGPEKFPNPDAAPFIREIRDGVQKHPESDGSEAAWTALSIVVLLDQITRNIFRTNEGLGKIYNHYDKISYSLITNLLSSDAPVHRADLHPQWYKSPAHRLWFYLPLVHSEVMSAHDKYDEIMGTFKEEMDKEEGYENEKFLLTQALKAEKDHRDILDSFGRYPHRNGAMGRETTSEEKKFLDEGGATFGVAQEKE